MSSIATSTFRELATAVKPVFRPDNLVDHLAQLGRGQKLVGKVASSKSSSAFWADTFAVLIPKLLFLVRSLAEGIEAFVLEVVESCLFYFGPHVAGNKVFKPLVARIAEKNGVDSALLLKSMAKGLAPETEKKLLTSKAAIIMASLAAVGVSGEFILSHVKNLLTIGLFGQSRFSDIAGLTNHHQDKKNPAIKAKIDLQNKKVKVKAHRRIKQSVAFSASVIAAAAALARFGHKIPGELGLLKRFVNLFDFSFRDGKLALAQSQKVALITMGVIGYIDAARDRLERLETVSRLAVVAPFLMFGQGLLQNGLARLVATRFPELLEHSLDTAKPNFKLDYDEIARLAAKKAEQFLVESGKPVTDKALAEVSKGLAAPLIKAQNALFILSFLVGSVAVGGIVTGISQHFTNIRFARQKALEQQLAEGSGNSQVQQERTAHREHLTDLFVPDSWTSPSPDHKVSAFAGPIAAPVYFDPTKTTRLPNPFNAGVPFTPTGLAVVLPPVREVRSRVGYLV